MPFSRTAISRNSRAFRFSTWRFIARGHFSPYNTAVRVWSMIAAGACIAVWAARAIVESPGKYVDFYFKDRYVPVSKRALVAGAVVGLMVPLAVVALRLARSRSR